MAVGGALVGGAAVAALKTAQVRRRARRTESERAFRLNREETVPDGLRRIARGQIDSSIERLRGDTREDLATAVHESRKSLKRLRAVLRLARDDLPDEIYDRENTVFRDLGRGLAEARDREVMLDTLDGLLKTHGDGLASGDVRQLRARLVAQRDQANAGLVADREARGKGVSELERARLRTAAWTFDHSGFRMMEPGLRRIYRRGRDRFQAARKDPSADNLHEWRKRVKDLWYACQVLRSASPKQMKALASRAHDVSDLLGDDHDLAVLAAEVREHRDEFDDESISVALEGVIQRRRGKLQRTALSAGADLFADKPKRFVWRIERRWHKRLGSAVLTTG